LLESRTESTIAPGGMPPKPSLAGRRDELRRLERLLQPPSRRDPLHECFNRPLLRGPRLALEENRVSRHALAQRDVFELRDVSYARRPRAAWGVSLMLLAGGLAFACGMTLLVAANVLIHAAAWRWGFAMTMAGEGLLIGGLTIMAVRLWRNSRRLNAQLSAVDRRLVEFQSGVCSEFGEARHPAPLRGAVCVT
jgi:hypothetical protein